MWQAADDFWHRRRNDCPLDELERRVVLQTEQIVFTSGHAASNQKNFLWSIYFNFRHCLSTTDPTGMKVDKPTNTA